MMYKAFLVKYAEIGIKGKNRHLFEKALCVQMEHALAPVDGNFQVTREMGRIYVNTEGDFDYEGAVDALTRVFGIAEICPVVILEDTGFEDLAEAVVSYVKELYPTEEKTFKVCARRANKNYPMHTMEVNCELGGRILDVCPNLKVDGYLSERRAASEDLSVLREHRRPWRYAGRHKRTGHAAAFRRYRQPGCRIHDRKTRC